MIRLKHFSVDTMWYGKNNTQDKDQNKFSMIKNMKRSREVYEQTLKELAQAEKVVAELKRQAAREKVRVISDRIKEEFIPMLKEKLCTEAFALDEPIPNLEQVIDQLEDIKIVLGVWGRSFLIFKFKGYEIDVPTIGDHILRIEGHRYRLGYRDEPRIFSKISSARGGPKIPGLTARLYEPIHWLFKSHDLDGEFNKFYQEIV